jgi:hypothetical protein
MLLRQIVASANPLRGGIGGLGIVCSSQLNYLSFQYGGKISKRK